MSPAFPRWVQQMAGPKANRRFLTTLGWVPQLMLNGAVFFLFAILGFFIDLSSLAEMRPWGAAIAAAVLGGLVSLGYLQAAMRGVRWVPLALVWQGLLTLATARLAPHRPPGPVAPTVEWLTHRARLDGVGIMVCVVVAYTLFIAFITRQGVRGVRLGTEIGLARDIQRRLVPALDRRSGRLEVFGEAMPSSEVACSSSSVIAICSLKTVGSGLPTSSGKMPRTAWA